MQSPESITWNWDSLQNLAIEVKTLLELQQHRLVLAESCTAGMVSSVFGSLPGISESLCGSWVVYRLESKAQWLGLSREQLHNPAFGTVCPETTSQLAASAIMRTPEATLSCSVTGHLGPGVSEEIDGQVFISIAKRTPEAPPSCSERRLRSPRCTSLQDFSRRRERQQEATFLVLQELLQSLRNQ